ncbi:MAG: NAD-dependent epimerase/dehydratase family protein [Thermoguttaceae bacterium]|nr:NAD-dependent epimerase/dehydratase family protein [Thermoguttaceae bacterium]
MMDGTILLTGASGFIGTTLTRQLLADGNKVRGLSRKEPKLPPGFTGTEEELWKHPNFEYAAGDIMDKESLNRAMEGCRYVIHMAGFAKNYSRDPSVFERINKNGMENVFDVAQQRGIEKIVWTSSIVTLGPTDKGQVGDESMPRHTDQYLTEYEQSKTIAEHEALRRAAAGLPVVIVLPTRVYGPGQFTEGNSLARIIDDYRRGRFPFLINLGVNVGNYGLVDDVACGHYLALQKGRVGERYILGGENASLKEFFRLIDQVTGKRHFKLPLLKFWPMVVGHSCKLGAKLFGIYPPITPGWVRTFMVDWAFPVKKAETELGYQPTPLKEGLARTCRWLEEYHRGR